MPGASVDMTSFRLVGANNIYLANMLLWGPGFMTSSALLMSMIVERIVESLESSGERSSPSNHVQHSLGVGSGRY